MQKPAAAIQLPPEFPFPLRLERVAPMRADVMELFAFRSPSLGLVEVEAGFDTDYASVPRILWNLYPPDGDYTPAAVIHDALYWHQATREHGGFPITRAEADTVFLEAMEALGIPLVRRRLLYRAVRVGGGFAWAANAAAQGAKPSRDTSFRSAVAPARRGPRSR